MDNALGLWQSTPGVCVLALNALCVPCIVHVLQGIHSGRVGPNSIFSLPEVVDRARLHPVG